MSSAEIVGSNTAAREVCSNGTPGSGDSARALRASAAICGWSVVFLVTSDLLNKFSKCGLDRCCPGWKLLPGQPVGPDGKRRFKETSVPSRAEF